VEHAFNSPSVTAFFLLITAALLVIAEKVGKRNRSMESMGWKDSVIVGIFQAIAIFPGISRSGSTITGGMIRDLERPSAARFAFLMSIPTDSSQVLGMLDY
jgi:undecaprenyl-diphosphatase